MHGPSLRLAREEVGHDVTELASTASRPVEFDHRHHSFEDYQFNLVLLAEF